MKTRKLRTFVMIVTVAIYFDPGKKLLFIEHSSEEENEEEREIIDSGEDWIEMDDEENLHACHHYMQLTSHSTNTDCQILGNIQEPISRKATT